MTTDDKAAASQQLLQALWIRGLPQLQQRLKLLDRAAQAGSLSADDRLEAASTAHKLAGSLGMFGYPGGTSAARALEVELDGGAGTATLAPLAKKLRRELGL